MYIPPAGSIPLLEAKNAVQAETGVSTNSVYLSGSYAFSDKYALTIHGSLSFRNFSNRYDLFKSTNDPGPSGPFVIDPVKSSFSHHYIEAGVGRYNLLQSAWKLEVFGGGGYGYASHGSSYRNEYWLGFVQGNFGRRWKMVELGWSLRMACSGFHFVYPAGTSYPLELLHQNFNNIHVEPLVIFRVGRGPIQGFARGGVSMTTPLKSFAGIDLDYGIDSEKLVYTISHLSVGVSYRF